MAVFIRHAARGHLEIVVLLVVGAKCADRHVRNGNARTIHDPTFDRQERRLDDEPSSINARVPVAQLELRWRVDKPKCICGTAGRKHGGRILGPVEAAARECTGSVGQTVRGRSPSKPDDGALDRLSVPVDDMAGDRGSSRQVDVAVARFTRTELEDLFLREHRAAPAIVAEEAILSRFESFCFVATRRVGGQAG